MDDQAGVVGMPLAAHVAGRWPSQRTIERMIARGYGLSYDAVVRGFPPYEALLDEIASFVGRGTPADGRDGRRLRVLDVSCAIGTVAARLARDGHLVTGVDAVDHLVEIARRRASGIGGRSLSFHAIDIASGAVPGTGTFDVLVSPHTLYWHPDPEAVLAACRRALRPGGHALFLTYGRPARVGRIFADVRAERGLVTAVRALRWLVPTAVFETLRDCDHRYLTADAFHELLRGAGFEILETRRTFLAQLSHLAWTRTL
jgi:2-polyprenyl-3-methyl-5-hydroxy-6-metoxy-1,4-benzoquinol methylase